MPSPEAKAKQEAAEAKPVESTPTESRDRLITKTQRKERGWSDRLLASLLPEPDQTKPNPHYLSGPPMRLYRLDRVVEAEGTQEFREATANLGKRRDAAQRAVATKLAKMEAYIEGVAIKVPVLSQEELIKRASDHYDARQAERGNTDGSNGCSDSFVERITVNYLRHQMSEYERHLRYIGGKVGAKDAYLEIKSKVLEAIGEAYPWLAEECDRQERRMWDKWLEEPPGR